MDIFVLKYELQNNSWIKHMYDDRKCGLSVISKEFFGGVRTTSRCEGWHSFLNDYISNRLNILEFVKQFGRALEKIRYNELKADHIAIHSNPLCTHVLKAYERQATKIYTPTSFMKFQEELKQESAYLMNECVSYEENDDIYQLAIWRNLSHTRKVIYNSFSETIRCSCLHFESYGFPCRHCITIMKLEQLPCIPNSIFLKRWTKKSKIDFSNIGEESFLLEEVLSSIRYGALICTCRRMCEITSKSSTTFKEITSEVTQIVSHLEEEHGMHISAGQFEGVQEPNLVKTKGMRSNPTSKSAQPRKCGECRKPGHTRTTCPLRTGVDQTVVARK